MIRRVAIPALALFVVGAAQAGPASLHTKARQDALRDSLPFEDQRDFEEHKRGFIAEPPYRTIVDENGKTVWDMAQYDFLLTGEQFDSISSSVRSVSIISANAS